MNADAHSFHPLFVRALVYVVLFLAPCVLPCREAFAQGFQAGFSLKVQTNTGITESSGVLEYLSPTEIYLQVEKPEQQRIWVQGPQLTLYYPLQKRLMKGTGAARSSAPMFDGLIVALQEPGQGTFEQARLTSRSTTPQGKLEQVWRLDDKKGKPIGALLVVENGDGIESLILLDDKKRHRRRYQFGARVRVQNLKVPLWIVAEHLTEAGAHLRIETWKLLNPLPIGASPKRHAGQVPDIPTGLPIEDMSW